MINLEAKNTKKKHFFATSLEVRVVVETLLFVFFFGSRSVQSMQRSEGRCWKQMCVIGQT